ncbi:MAG: hypothetical protein R3B98_05555 [Hyphomonas sp.]
MMAELGALPRCRNFADLPRARPSPSPKSASCRPLTCWTLACPAWVLAWGGEFLNADWTQTWDCSSCDTEAEVKAFFAQPRVKALDDMPMDLRRRIAGRTPQAAPPRPHCPSSLLEPDT